MKHIVVVLVLTLTASTTHAKAQEKIYPASCDRVWAAVKSAATPPHYNFAQLDDTQKKGLISTGNAMTGKRYLDITLSGAENTCTVAIGGNFSGLAHNDKGDLFKRIDQALAGVPPESDLKANEIVPAVVTNESQGQSAQQAKSRVEIQKPNDEAGTILVRSVPDAAEVYVDGNFVGDAPATLRLAPGKHTIRVTSSGFRDWSRELSVLASSDAKLAATLEKQE